MNCFAVTRRSPALEMWNSLVLHRLAATIFALAAACIQAAAQTANPAPGSNSPGTQAPGLAQAKQSFAAGIAGGYANPWGIYPVAQALGVRYQTSRDFAYLETGLEQIAQLRALTASATGKKDELTGESEPVWLSSSYSCGIPMAFAVHNAAIAAPYLQLIHAMLADEKPRWRQEQLAGILSSVDFFEANINYFARRFVEIDGGLALGALDSPAARTCDQLAGYRSSPLLPLNMIAAYGEANAALYHIFRDIELHGAVAKAAKYKAVTLKIAAYVKAQMRPGEAGSLTWDYMPAGRIEDVSHAILSIRFLVYLKQVEPSSVSDELIEKLIRTFHFVYGAGAKDVKSHLSLTYGRRGQMRFITSLGEWAVLAPYDRTIIPKIEALYRGLYDDKGRMVVPNPLLMAMIERARKTK